MNIVSDCGDSYRIRLGNCAELKLNKSFVCVVAGLTLACNVPATSIHIKPLVDFSISTASSFVNSIWIYLTYLIGLFFLYLMMECTGLLKEFQKIYNRNR